MARRLRPRLAAPAVLALLALVAGCGSGNGSADAAPGPPASASASARPTTGTPAEPTPATPTDRGGIDYVVDGVWHQRDGDAVELPRRDYASAVIWNDLLVATRPDGEVYAVADVLDVDGSVVDTFDTTAAVVVNETGTTIGWVDTDGNVRTAWEADRVKMGEVDLAAPGETVAYSAVAVTGGPSCFEAEDGCIVYLNGLEEPRSFDSHGIDDNPVPSAIETELNDVSGDSLVTYRGRILDEKSCSGLADLTKEGDQAEWTTCDYEPAQISPDSAHVIGLPAYYDGLGLPELSVLAAATGEETGRYGAPEGGFISQWSWSADGRVVFDLYGGGRWRLLAMSTDGEITEIGEPAEGEEFDSPFALIQH